MKFDEEEQAIDSQGLATGYPQPAQLRYHIEQLQAQLVMAKESFANLQKASKEILTEALAAALEQQQRAEKAEALRDEWCQEYTRIRDQEGQLQAKLAAVTTERDFLRRSGVAFLRAHKPAVDGSKWRICHCFWDVQSNALHVCCNCKQEVKP